MARKPLSTIDWKQRHERSVDKIFAEPLKEIESSSPQFINVHEKIEQYEQKARLNFNKNRPAPPPPGTQVFLPKIGNYTPKILLSRNSSKASAPKSPYEDAHIPDFPPSENKLYNKQYSSEQTTERKLSSAESFKTKSKSECNTNPEEDIYHTIDIKPDYEENKIENEGKKVMIIGDKDVPLVLDTYFGADDNEDNENSPVAETNSNVSPSNESEEDKLFADHDTIVNVGEVVVNPLFEEHGKQEDHHSHTETENETPRHYKKRRAPGVPTSSYVSRRRNNSQSSHASDDEYPYIPEPDYEEHERTMNFDYVENNDQPIAPPRRNRNRKVVQENDGEDFSKYMEDDDGFHEQPFTWRKNIKHARTPNAKTKQPPIQKSKYSERSMMSAPKLKPVKKPKTKAETQHGSMKRQTLRDITYADCKMGIDDRTIRSVKSTSAGGRYIKRGKERTMIVDGDTGAGGYEEFLRMRHKEDGSLESNSSGDSGLDNGDDLLAQEQMFYQMQPKNVRDKKSGTLWEKLTWRFKRHVGDYRMS